MPLRAVLFDLDETLLDFGRSQRAALRASLSSLGLPFSTRHLHVFRALNDRIWERYRKGLIAADELAIRRFHEYLQATDEHPRGARRLARTFERELSGRAHPFPGCRAALRSLAKSFRLGLVTNGLTRVQNGRLKASCLDRFFETVVTSQACGVAKPDPEILRIALDALDLKPREAVYVGDDLAVDYAAARAAGVPFVWVDRGKRVPRGLRRPKRRAEHLADVARLLL